MLSAHHAAFRTTGPLPTHSTLRFYHWPRRGLGRRKGSEEPHGVRMVPADGNQGAHSQLTAFPGGIFTSVFAVSCWLALTLQPHYPKVSPAGCTCAENRIKQH